MYNIILKNIFLLININYYYLKKTQIIIYIIFFNLKLKIENILIINNFIFIYNYIIIIVV